MDRYLEHAAERHERARPARQGPAHQRHQLLPRSAGVRSPGEEDRSRPGPQPPARSPPAHLDRRVQHGRGDLFPRHALPRGRSTAAKRDIKLQVFASDVDPDAVATAREGLYPETIEADVSPARLARFFTKEDHGYRVLPDLRAAVVFTVQDVLADPPFSRLDLVSCRNLLIYLRPEAQAKVVSLFHFALREGGILLLGSSETVGNVDGRFEVISKAARLYRHIGRSRPGEVGFSMSAGDGVRVAARPEQGPAPSRQGALAELCRRLVMEAYAPAAVLINRKHECLYSLGPTDRYLRVAPGHPTHDLLAMAREGMRTKLRSAIQRASQENARIVVTGGRTRHDGNPGSFSIDVQPVLERGRGAAADLLRRRAEAGAEARSPRRASGTLRGSPSSSRSSRPRERSCRAPSATSRSRTRSRRRSTKRHCPSTRNSNRRTRSC